MPTTKYQLVDEYHRLNMQRVHLCADLQTGQTILHRLSEYEQSTQELRFTAMKNCIAHNMVGKLDRVDVVQQKMQKVHKQLPENLIRKLSMTKMVSMGETAL